MEKEIIVAIDGSAYSDHSLSYIKKLFAGQENSHFHLCSWVSATASIMPSVADPRDSLIPDSGVSKKEIAARRSLDRALEKLTSAGIAPERVRTSVISSGYNIAGSIQQMADKNLPDAIMLGRRGLTGVTEMLMGSVSAAVFKNCHNTPLWIIDGEIEHKDFLVTVDGSPASLMAVDHLAHILNGRKDIRIYLFHCTSLFSKKIHCDMKYFYENWDRGWCDKNLSGNDCLFRGPQQLLLAAGIPESNIKALPEKSDFEEAHGIIKEAIKQNCGTIVIGRRGVGMAKGLFGGVSDRTVKRVENLALWVVG